VAGIGLAPGIDDANDGLAGVIQLRASHGGRPRAVAERAHVVRPEPAVAP